MEDSNRTLDILERIVVVETKLTSMIQKVEQLIGHFAEQQKDHQVLLTGSWNEPGLIARVAALEESRKTVRWALGVIYVAIITAAVRVISI